MPQLTPMMQQYLEIKEQNPDAILMYRLGDFYEMFFEDAKTAAVELDLVLTGRDCCLEERAPMCGVPHHAVDSYIGKLVENGHRVAVCEQLEDPKSAKGIVKRGITRIVTAGTVTSPQMLNEKENSYILAVVVNDAAFGISWCDVSTGEFYFRDNLDDKEFASALLRIAPREVVLSDQNGSKPEPVPGLREGVVKTFVPAWLFRMGNAEQALKDHFALQSLARFGTTEMTDGLVAAGALIGHLHETQKSGLDHITTLAPVRRDAFMVLDTSTVRNLELVATMNGGKRKGSLLWLLDRTRTAAGGRLLKKTILEPLLRKADIDRRLDAIAALHQDPILRQEIRLALDGVKDLERILSRLAYGTLNAKDALGLKQSLAELPKLKEMTQKTGSKGLAALAARMDPMSSLKDHLERALCEDPPNVLTEGGIFRRGYCGELDELLTLSEDGMDKLVELETKEKQRTGIRTLKVKYNRVFGYFLEVSKGALASVPERYERKQTLANGERFITAELKALEEKLLSATERRQSLEYSLFVELRDRIRSEMSTIQKTAHAVAQLDVLQSMAQVAYENDYVRPLITDDGTIQIRGGRHPVVENVSREAFVPNDTELDVKGNRMLLITGPNMGGKSTFMRQTGLIVLMAHIGSFVPAAEASICLVDRIFTRVGASDDLASGQSTFMVEMSELANILHNATPRSLLILDEIGRGTSTSDGLAIAQAAARFILDRIGAKALFATHFHELVSLADTCSGIRNMSVAVKEFGRDIIFLHRVVPGATDRSFGIEVARLAGLPTEVIADAAAALKQLEQHSGAPSVPPASEASKAVPPALLSIMQTNLDTLAPLEALTMIYTLQKELRGTDE